MKILVFGVNSPDYMQDDLYHGLKTVYGTDIESNVNLSYLYSDYDGYTGQLYGRGFSYAKNIDPELRVVVNKRQIFERLQSRYYDSVIYLSNRRSMELFDVVVAYLDRHKIALIDGEDDTEVMTVKGTIQFKRELISDPHPHLFPISFAMPAEKICRISPVKERMISAQVPSSDRKYAFSSEAEYYEEYQSSIYAITHKKTGWDCKRHYEIMANHCIPLFEGIADCPENIMTTLPKKYLARIAKNHHKAGESTEREWRLFLVEWLWQNCTTASLAEYVVDRLMG